MAMTSYPAAAITCIVLILDLVGTCENDYSCKCVQIVVQNVPHPLRPSCRRERSPVKEKQGFVLWRDEGSGLGFAVEDGVTLKCCYYYRKDFKTGS